MRVVSASSFFIASFAAGALAAPVQHIDNARRSSPVGDINSDTPRLSTTSSLPVTPTTPLTQPSQDTRALDHPLDAVVGVPDVAPPAISNTPTLPTFPGPLPAAPKATVVARGLELKDTLKAILDALNIAVAPEIPTPSILPSSSIALPGTSTPVIVARGIDISDPLKLILGALEVSTTPTALTSITPSTAFPSSPMPTIAGRALDLNDPLKIILGALDVNVPELPMQTSSLIPGAPTPSIVSRDVDYNDPLKAILDALDAVTISEVSGVPVATVAPTVSSFTATPIVTSIPGTMAAAAAGPLVSVNPNELPPLLVQDFGPIRGMLNGFSVSAPMSSVGAPSATAPINIVPLASVDSSTLPIPSDPPIVIAGDDVTIPTAMSSMPEASSTTTPSALDFDPIRDILNGLSVSATPTDMPVTTPSAGVPAVDTPVLLSSSAPIIPTTIVL